MLLKVAFITWILGYRFRIGFRPTTPQPTHQTSYARIEEFQLSDTSGPIFLKIYKQLEKDKKKRFSLSGKLDV
jgi:hypothetical protein